MNSARMIVLGVASLAGISCVALLARGLASGHSRVGPVISIAAPVQHPTVRVLVAKHDLAVGARIAPEDLNWQPWPVEAVNPAFVTDGPARPVNAPPSLRSSAMGLVKTASAAITSPADGPGAAFVGAIVRERMLANEPMLEQKVVHAGAAGVLAITLDAGKRAMALPLSAESAAGGFILPGDHVDVVLSRQSDGVMGTHDFVTSTVMKNVRVLAVDQNTGAQKTAAVIGATATLEVSPEQAELLVLAKAQGQLTLVLRSYADAAGPATALPRRHADAGADVVRVFRNGVSTPVTVSR